MGSSRRGTAVMASFWPGAPELDGDYHCSASAPLADAAVMVNVHADALGFDSLGIHQFFEQE